jgi:RNA polymerase sigma factor, sigma-70 family
LDDLPTEPAIPGRETGDDTLWQAVQTLPRDQREAVVLFYYEDLPTEEIARIVGTSPGAVRVRLSRAREKLRSILKEGDYG